LLDAADLVPGFVPETDLERAVAQDPQLLAGLAWGKPRKGHPEGTVGAHVADLLATIDRDEHPQDVRTPLRFIALVHDAFKYRVHEWLPKTGANHHAARARRFAEGFTDDERVLAAIEFHDGPYAIWRKMKRRGKLDEGRLAHMLERMPDPELLQRFVELDGSTEGKNPEPIRWFRDELRRRGLLGRSSVRRPP
jgi:hypothetical protein